jgi:hypothetical protein
LKLFITLGELAKQQAQCTLLQRSIPFRKKDALQIPPVPASVRSHQGEREKNEYLYDAVERAKVIKI